MTIRRDLSQIMPSDLVSGTYDGSSIIEILILASSNALRKFLDLKKQDLIPRPIPKFVTRKDPSLDNYCADLFLRTLYEPTNSLPTYEEHIIRDDPKVLSSSYNPRLVGSVLIGIGGSSKNPDFVAVYDEHAEAGTRSAESTARIVINRHLNRAEHEAAKQKLEPPLAELDWIDAHGGAAGNHLKNLARNLHLARFIQPGFVSETLEPQWKRAILSSIISAVFIANATVQAAQYDLDKAESELNKEYDNYIEKRKRMVREKYMPEIKEETVSYCRKEFTKASMSQIHGKPSFFTPGRILAAMKVVWPSGIISFILSFIFEASLQTQEEFYRLMNATTPFKKLSNGVWFLYYDLEPNDMLPHRAFLKKLNDDHKAGIVIVYNPFRQITAIFKNNYLKDSIWQAFVKTLIDKEGPDVWYVIRQEDGRISDFILNGTEYFVGVPMTRFVEDDYIRILEKIRE